MLPLVARARTFGISIVLATTGLGGYATIPASANGSVTWHVQAGNLDDLTFTSVAHEVTAFTMPGPWSTLAMTSSLRQSAITR